MKLAVREDNGVCIVELEGSLDRETSPVAREKLSVFLKNNTKLILDMSKVDFLSSAGLRLLLLVYHELAEKNGKIVLMGVSSDIKTIMSHTGFFKFFAMADTLDDALLEFY